MAPGIVRLVQEVGKPENEKSRNSFYVFLICLGISIFLWFLVMLSKESFTTIDYQIIFKNVPEDLILVNKPDSILSFNVASGGFELFTQKHLTRKRPIEIDLSNLNIEKQGKYFKSTFPTSGISNDIIYTLGLSEELVSISPQNIHFKFEALSGKKIKVIPNLDLKFVRQFQLSDTIKVTPDSVMIVGPKKEIEDIKYIETAFQEIQNINESITITTEVYIAGRSQEIICIPNEVELFIPVEKYTEASIEVPVSFINAEGLRVKTYPEKVKITYLVALENFKRVDQEMFVASIDLNDETNSSNKLKVNVSHKPSFVKVINTEPGEVEFLVIK